MSRIKLLGTIGAGPTLAMLAVLLLLCSLAFPGTARAQGETNTVPCVTLALPAELAELELEAVQAALQENPESAITLSQGGQAVATIRADLLLADEAALVALLEGEPVNITFDFGGDPNVVVADDIGVSTPEDCTLPGFCVSGVELPAALADLDVAGLRAALEEMLSGDANATVAVPFETDPAIVRADLLSGLEDPVLEALLAGDPLSVTVNIQDLPFEIVGIALPGPECEGAGGPPAEEPKPGPIPDNQQGGGKDTTPDNQQGGGDKTPDNQQDGEGKDTGTGAGKTPDNQQGGDTVTKTFELTVNGTPPASANLSVSMSFEDPDRPGAFLEYNPQFCGTVGQTDVPGTAGQAYGPCEGDGTVYTYAIEFPAGTQLEYRFLRCDAPPCDFASSTFFNGTETLNADMTNAAFYNFGTGAGDDQQDDKDAGAGDDEQVTDNQQTGGEDAGAGDDQQDGENKDTGSGSGDDTEDDAQEDVQDDQQGEMPEEMPETGAGALAPGATISVGSAVAGLTMLIGAGYAVLRRSS